MQEVINMNCILPNFSSVYYYSCVTTEPIKNFGTNTSWLKVLLNYRIIVIRAFALL